MTSWARWASARFPRPLDPSGRTAHLAATTLIAFLRRYIYEQVDLADL